jgi:hypothetical protein
MDTEGSILGGKSLGSFSGEVKNQWNYTCTPPHAFMICTQTRLPITINIDEVMSELSSTATCNSIRKMSTFQNKWNPVCGYWVQRIIGIGENWFLRSGVEEYYGLLICDTICNLFLYMYRYRRLWSVCSNHLQRSKNTGVLGVALFYGNLG